MADSSSSHSSQSVQHGKVKWFNNAKGYGFIVEDGKTEDLFAHYSAIQMEGYKTLKAGQAVNFKTTQGPKGVHAVEIMAATEVQPAPHAAASTPTHKSEKQTA